MSTTPTKPPGAARAGALIPKEERSENCYCSALPSGSGPCLPCYGHWLRLSEAAQESKRAAEGDQWTARASSERPSEVRRSKAADEGQPVVQQQQQIQPKKGDSAADISVVRPGANLCGEVGAITGEPGEIISTTAS